MVPTWLSMTRPRLGARAVLLLALLSGVVSFAATPLLAAPAAAPPSVQSCAAAVLHMTPGLHNADGTLNKHWKIAPSISDLPFYAALPLYPGATPTQIAGQPSYSWDGSEYVETAVARYLVPATPQAARAWYRSAMTACGYIYKGYVAYEKGKTLISKGLMFIAPALGDGFEVYVSLQAQGAASSILVIYPSTTNTPSRPSWSYPGPTCCRSVTIQYVPSGGKSQIAETITRADAVSNLAEAFSLPTLEDVGIHTCFGSTAFARVWFHLTSGKTMYANVLPSCFHFTVNGSPPIGDWTHGVWSAVQATLFSYCIGHKCTKAPYKA